MKQFFSAYIDTPISSEHSSNLGTNNLISLHVKHSLTARSLLPSIVTDTIWPMPMNTRPSIFVENRLIS